MAGSDGCLPSATTCAPGGGTAGDSNNLPENYNGAQEFYYWWKGVGTTHTPQPNGKLGLGSRRVTISSRRAAGS